METVTISIPCHSWVRAMEPHRRKVNTTGLKGWNSKAQILIPCWPDQWGLISAQTLYFPPWIPATDVQSVPWGTGRPRTRTAAPLGLNGFKCRDLTTKHLLCFRVNVPDAFLLNKPRRQELLSLFHRRENWGRKCKWLTKLHTYKVLDKNSNPHPPGLKAQAFLWLHSVSFNRLCQLLYIYIYTHTHAAQPQI